MKFILLLNLHIRENVCQPDIPGTVEEFFPFNMSLLDFSCWDNNWGREHNAKKGEK